MLVTSWTTAFCVCVVCVRLPACVQLCVDYKVRVDRQSPWQGHKTVILLPLHTSLHSSLIPGFPPSSLQLLGPLTSLHADSTEWHWMLFKVQTLFSIPFEHWESVWLKLLRWRGALWDCFDHSCLHDWMMSWLDCSALLEYRAGVTWMDGML